MWEGLVSVGQGDAGGEMDERRNRERELDKEGVRVAGCRSCQWTGFGLKSGRLVQN